MHLILIFLMGCFVGTFFGVFIMSLLAMTKDHIPDTSGWRCRVCGCTDLEPCITDEGPCSWVEKDLCSACVKLVDCPECGNQLPSWAAECENCGCTFD